MEAKLTKEEILKLEGRELDAAVAEYVMGLKCEVRLRGETNMMTVYQPLVDGMHSREDAERYGSPLPYSTDMGAAWQVVDRLRQMGRVVVLKADGLRRPPNAAYTVLVDSLPRVDGRYMERAICQAVLLAVVADAVKVKN